MLLIKVLSLSFILILLKSGLSLGATPVAPLPKSTEEMLKKLKLDPSILSNLDKELEMPKSWLDGARKEGKLRVFSTFDPPQADVLFRPFKERYPFIGIEYSRASHEDRAVRTIVAYKNKRIVTDVLTGLGGSFFMYKEINALEDMRNIPTWKNNPPDTSDPEGLWVGMHMRYWCMAYNTRFLKKEDMPKKWDDLLTNPKFRSGNLALGNRPQLWALVLWKANGEKWIKDFLSKLFSELQPQLRREGMNAMLELLAAGEFHATIPSAEYRTYQKVLDGAPVNYHCPEPVPIAVSEMGILKGSPNINSARVFVNWFLSKEGQIAQYLSDYAPPVHKDLRRKEFVPFADEILPKKGAFRDPAIELEIQPKLLAYWDELWLRSGGKRRGR
ncbi:MAG TPA: extracellular solute-binding protein [Candidatus Binatia bacterium]|nr:extracellular solute-binding protein [Candidatus Binatia bacterium]